MKTWSARIAIVLFSVCATAANARSAAVTVEVTGVEGGDGLMSIGLYQDPKGWPEKGKEFLGKDAAVTGETVSHTFADIPPGTYAVAVFHDANANLKLDKNFVGMPKEGYGFSNNIFGAMGTAPEFEKASFRLRNELKVVIRLDY